MENHQGEQFVLTQNNYGIYSLVDKSGTIYVFNNNKQLTSLYDPTQKNNVTFNYNGSGGTLSSMTDSVGRSITFTTNANGQVSTVNAAGRIWTYGYSNGNLVSVTDPVRRVTQYEYSTPYGNSYLSKITYPTGGYTTYTYSATTGTDNPHVRVNQQTVYTKGGTTVRQVTFGYTPSLPNYQTSSTVTFSDGSTVQGYLNYLFTLNNVTITTQNSQAQAIRKTIKQFNGYGQVVLETVYPSRVRE